MWVQWSSYPRLSTQRPATCFSCWLPAPGSLPTSERPLVRSASCGGFWLDGARKLAWLEDYAASLVANANQPAPDRLADGIRFEHVSFAYPGTDRTVLDDVNLHLPAGKVIAVVGENGAGKTTLVKLLCGLYQPTKGRITIDGADLAHMAPDQWRARLSGAFQDFFRFEFRAQNTVGIG